MADHRLRRPEGGRNRGSGGAGPAPLVLSGWSDGAAPEDFDAGSPTGPFPIVDIRSLGVASGGMGNSYDREVVTRAKLVAEVSSGDGMELPHWADPPTGEVPRALAGPTESEDAMQAWRLLGSRGLHWRDDMNDWDDGPGVEELLGDEGPVPEHGGEVDGPYSFDADFERLETARRSGGRHSGDREGKRGSYDIEVVDGPEPVSSDASGDTEGQTSPGTVRLPPPPAGPGGGHRLLGGQGRSLRHRSQARSDRSPSKSRAGARPGSSVRVVSPGASEPVVTDDRAGQRPAGNEAGRAERRPYDVTAEQGMSKTGRDVGAAVTTGLAMAVVFVFAYLIGAGALLALACVALAGCAIEAFSMLQRAGFRPATLVGALGTLAAVLATYWKGPGALGPVVVLVSSASLVWYLAKVVEARPVVNAAVTTLAFCWVGAMGSFAGVLLGMPLGSRLLVGAVVPTVISDMAAWFAGSRFGSHHMAPSVSPGKTWEGFFAGAVAAVVVGAIIGSVLAPWTLTRGIVLGLMIAVVAPMGDLAQSMVKRDLRLKDSGALLPGHGGLLDRFDSVLFALPATYFLVTVLHIG